MGESRNVSLADAATQFARLYDAVEREDRFQALRHLLGRFCGFENFIVYQFDGAHPPELMGSSLPEPYMREQMTEFVWGLFLLDPFVIEANTGVEGLLRLDEIAPQDFRESELFKRHYRFVNVLDELRYIIPVGDGRIVHVFVERELPNSRFSDEDIDVLKALYPIVRSFTQARVRWLARMKQIGDRPLVALNLPERIDAMAPSVLTARECQVVELILRGCSAKRIGSALGIEEGTVTNHKRNIYAKLNIHSQAQLFDLFLRSVTTV